MQMTMADLRSSLREKGYKLTFQRMAVYEALMSGPEHPTAEEVHNYVSQKLPMIGLSTVYNALETLCELGCITKLTLEPNVTRYDIHTQPHIHMICVQCGEIREMDCQTFEHCRQNVREKIGFHILRHFANFHGYCAGCWAEFQDRQTEPPVQ